jgi:hypothetical protein
VALIGAPPPPPSPAEPAPFATAVSDPPPPNPVLEKFEFGSPLMMVCGNPPM